MRLQTELDNLQQLHSELQDELLRKPPSKKANAKQNAAALRLRLLRAQNTQLKRHVLLQLQAMQSRAELVDVADGALAKLRSQFDPARFELGDGAVAPAYRPPPAARRLWPCSCVQAHCLLRLSLPSL